MNFTGIHGFFERQFKALRTLCCNRMQVSREKFIEVIGDVVGGGHFPHLHFCGPHEDEVHELVKSIISPHYSNKSMLLDIHILDNVSESSLIQMINAFCNLKAVVADTTERPKIVVIHQQNEILTESFVHFLEDRMSEKQVKFVFLTSSMHIVPVVLTKKMVSFTIHPKKVANTIDKEDNFYKLISSDQDDETLANKIIDWSDMHRLRIPTVIYDEWSSLLLKK